MVLGNMIHKIRTDAKLTQVQFGELFGVSQQTVQKWENGNATPELDRIVAISKRFDVSLDLLILGNGKRVVEEMKTVKALKPQYHTMHTWESYAANFLTEYQQSVEEGLDIEAYADVFAAASRLPGGEIKEKLGDVLFEVVLSADQKEGYPYSEPSDLEGIKALRKPVQNPVCAHSVTQAQLLGAWMGRICGCMLGKTVEGIRTDELVPFLKETDNYPMHRYILRTDLNEEILAKYRFGFAGRCYADEIDGMPVDDDTNYVVLAQKILEDYGRDFTPFDVASAWHSAISSRGTRRPHPRAIKTHTASGSVRRSAETISDISIRETPRRRRKWLGEMPRSHT